MQHGTTPLEAIESNDGDATMASEFDNLAAELKKQTGLDLADVLRSTHAEAAMVVSSLITETLGAALRAKLFVEKKPVNDQMFNKDGLLSTFAQRIDAAHDLKLIDDQTHDDAHLVRRIRNKFAHATKKLHFDSPKTVVLAKQLSTYEAATSNQEAFLKAADNVSVQAGKAIKARS
jgi:DNA-binding MltR family transcriptional regulator